MKEVNMTFYQMIGSVSFRFELSYLEDINPSVYNKVGKLLFGGIEVNLYYVDKNVTMYPENLVVDIAYIEFQESPQEWVYKHLNKEVGTWINDCVLKFDEVINHLK